MKRLCARLGNQYAFAHLHAGARVLGDDIGLNDHEHTGDQAEIRNRLVLSARRTDDRRAVSAASTMGEVVIGRKARILDDLRRTNDFLGMRAGLQDFEDRVERRIRCGVQIAEERIEVFADGKGPQHLPAVIPKIRRDLGRHHIALLDAAGRGMLTRHAVNRVAHRIDGEEVNDIHPAPRKVGAFDDRAEIPLGQSRPHIPDQRFDR